MKFNRPTLITFTAPTCSGKSFILDHLSKDLYREYRKKDAKPFEPLLARIVSTTTRPARKGEVDGVDYFFISGYESLRLEQEGLFAELVEFRGVRYGVTLEEMEKKMRGELPPAVVLEPKGLRQYEILCASHGWDIFKIYVSTVESVRIERLNFRTSIDIRNTVSDLFKTGDQSSFLFHDGVLRVIENQMATHTDRLLSITGEERRWQGMNSWDAIVDGEDTKKAIAQIKQGIKWRNYRTSTTHERSAA